MRPSPAAGLLASPARNLIIGLVYILVVMVVATGAYVAAGWSFGDALYMVVITVYTVGFNEVHPLDTTLLRVVTIATIILGCTGVIFLTGALVQFITLNQINQVFGIKRMTNAIERLSNHIIICGYGRIGVQLARELDAGGADFVVIERDEPSVQRARELGYLCLLGDATDEDMLRAAGLLRARILATVLSSDAANVFITLSARSLNPAVEIIARGEEPSTETKLLQAGAHKVVLPTHIGAERVAEMILYPATAAFIRGSAEMLSFDKSLQNLGLNMEVMIAAPGSPAVGRSIRSLEETARGGFFVVQLNRREGGAVTNPDPGMIIADGDGLVLIGRDLRAGALFEAATKAGFRTSVR